MPSQEETPSSALDYLREVMSEDVLEKLLEDLRREQKDYFLRFDE